MINKISNISELRAEQVRLRLKINSLEAEIKNDFEKIKQNINPFHFLKTGVAKSGGNNFINELTAAGLAFGLDFLITRLIFKKSGFLKKMLLSALIQFAGSKILADKSDAIIGVIKNFIEKLKKEDKDQTYTYDSTTAADEY
jgi:hypothetical protein